MVAILSRPPIAGLSSCYNRTGHHRAGCTTYTYLDYCTVSFAACLNPCHARQERRSGVTSNCGRTHFTQHKTEWCSQQQDMEGGREIEKQFPRQESLPLEIFLSLAWSKLRLCSANHWAGYFSNLACDWLSIVWAYPEQETENGPWFSPLPGMSDYCPFVWGILMANYPHKKASNADKIFGYVAKACYEAVTVTQFVLRILAVWIWT